MEDPNNLGAQASQPMSPPLGESKSPTELGDKSVYEDNEELYQEHFLEQYKMYVASSDKISERRGRANVFFLTLQTSIFTVIGFLVEDWDQSLADGVRYTPEIAFLAITGVLSCYTWFRLINSYKQLNTAKFKVIERMEESLPCGPYVKEEWRELGEGKDPKIYRPLTNVERALPLIFIGMYCIFIFLFLMGK